ncbi:MAG: polyhydroxyalkanoate synthesis regulator DNA-binding domain-containing protein [Thermodesulfobacteriota bacterium]
MADKILLKKYANRRLYNTEKSTYITLDQAADLIKQGRKVEVIDAKTNDDVTAFTLTQIFLEEARKKNFLLPVPLLHLIIQYGDNLLEEFFEKYLEQAIKNFLVFKRTFDEQVKKWFDLGLDLSDMTQKTMTGVDPFHSFFSKSDSEGDKKKK